jgi:hypothetical protein
MNKSLGYVLIIYALLLAGLSYLAHQLAPKIAQTTLITGLVGGPLCLAWGLLAVGGKKGKALPILTLIIINFMMLSQTVITWFGGGREEPGRMPAALVITVLLLVSLGMLMTIAYAGILFGRPSTSPTIDRGAKSPTTGKPVIQSNAVKRP